MKFYIKLNEDGSRSAIFPALGNAEAKVDMFVATGDMLHSNEFGDEWYVDFGILHSGGKVYNWCDSLDGDIIDWQDCIGISKPRTRPRYERVFVQQKSKAWEIHPDYRAGCIEAVKNGLPFRLAHQYSPKVRTQKSNVPRGTIA